ncbi:DNA-protecting protein DprA [Palleronia caenipelagi]|uniref:DNA-protecting protein DprA n=1 Tax=Palleronia caenipelagi TaxID=2489174 RepID=A0A547Q7W2_9RHOB|nr:DNA-processing protein DprA [Palleronia caenipelagi]TRD22472.1 DNA-protecting protein DprA [Palleronia caenipelagi]
MRSHRVGPVTFRKLLVQFGSAGAALDALPGLAKSSGSPRYTPCSEADARRELDLGRAAGARPVALGSDLYPAALTELPDAPPLLWLRGHPELLHRPTIGMVGARNASTLGRRMAASLAHGVGAAGYVVASGLARGIDGACHEAALETGTVAVIAGGIDIAYPPEHEVLMARIAARGLLISARQPGLSPTARDFPRRNRIIAGLSRAVIVVEAALKSGSLITARDALDLGREVLAVPGHPFDGRAGGCNALIRDGATLIRGPRDVLDHLTVESPASRPEPPITDSPPLRASSGDLARRILDHLGQTPTPEDLLIRDLGLPAAEVARQLTLLELSGQIARDPGGGVLLQPPS